MEPEIRFCTSADGTRIAYGVSGEGPPLVGVPGWGVSMDAWAEDAAVQAWREGVGTDRQFVTFDRRGVGGSQREVEDIALEAHVADLGAVVDHLHLERFDLMGTGDGAAVAIAYAAQHPEGVSRLVLFGSYARGADVLRPDTIPGVIDLVKQNWSVARRLIAGTIYPSGPVDLQRSFSAQLRQGIAPEVAARYLQFQADVDVTALLPHVKAPALVLHRRGDRNIPIRGGRDVASLLPDARFVALDGDMVSPSHGDISYLDTMLAFLDEGWGSTQAAGQPPAGDVHTILFTDMESSSALRQQLGDAQAQALVRVHNALVRAAVAANAGSEIKHTGDGIMASFPAASGGLEAAVAIQRAVARHVDEHPDEPLRVYIGLNAGEPIAEEADLFGTSVDLAKRICDRAESGQILVSEVVRQLVAGKGFLFSDRGDTELRGFEDPVRLYEVRWREDV